MSEVSPSAEVERLREQLLKFVAGEIATKVASDPNLALSKAMTDAIDRAVAAAAQAEAKKLEVLDPAALAEQVVTATRTELAKQFGGVKGKGKSALEAAAAASENAEAEADAATAPTPTPAPAKTEENPLLAEPWKSIVLAAICLIGGVFIGYVWHSWQSVPAANSTDNFQELVIPNQIEGDGNTPIEISDDPQPEPSPSTSPAAEASVTGAAPTEQPTRRDERRRGEAPKTNPSPDAAPKAPASPRPANSDTTVTGTPSGN